MRPPPSRYRNEFDVDLNASQKCRKSIRATNKKCKARNERRAEEQKVEGFSSSLIVLNVPVTTGREQSFQFGFQLDVKCFQLPTAKLSVLQIVTLRTCLQKRAILDDFYAHDVLTERHNENSVRMVRLILFLSLTP